MPRHVKMSGQGGILRQIGLDLKFICQTIFFQAFYTSGNMSDILGKRKRKVTEVKVSRKRQAAESSSEESEGSDTDVAALDAQEIFRRHFEAQFEALPEVTKPVAEEGESEDDVEDDEEGEEEEWGGISENEDDGIVIVQHTSTGSSTAGMSKEELKAFMVKIVTPQCYECTLRLFVEPQTAKLDVKTSSPSR